MSMSFIRQVTGSEKLIANWADLYDRRLYNLAAFELRTVTDRDPKHALAWFLAGQTELAMHRPEAAAIAFAKAREQTNSGWASGDFSRHLDRFRSAVQNVETLLSSNPLLTPPADAFEWLENPARISDRQDVEAPMESNPPHVAHLAQHETIQQNLPSPAAEKPKSATPPKAPVPEVIQSAPKEILSAPAADKIAVPNQSDPWAIWETRLQDHLARGNHREALKQVETALARHVESLWLTEWRARVLEQMGNDEEAASQFLHAAELAVKQGVRQKADHYASAALKLAGEKGDLLLGIATALLVVGVSKPGIDALRNAAQAYRRSGDAYKLANVLRLLNRHIPEDTAIARELNALTQKAVSNPATVPKAERKSSGLVLPPAPKLTTMPVRPPAPTFKPVESKADVSPQAMGLVAAGLLSFFFGCIGFGIIPLVAFFLVNTWLRHGGKNLPEGSPIRAVANVVRGLAIIAAIIGFLNTRIPF